MNFLEFARRHARALLFGALHSFYSAPGQTFCIGLFVASFTASLNLDATTIGGLYLVGTLASAATLLFVGHLIDRIRLVHFSAAVIVGLSLACFLAATAVGPLTLLLAIFALRLTGQGLMIHVEATATARAFERERGQALGITALGAPLSEIVFPPLAVAGIAAIGWRPTYAAFGAVGLFLLLPFTQWLLSGIRRAPPAETAGQGAWRSLGTGLAVLLRSRFVWAALPTMALFPFFMTAIMFHIATIAAARGWTSELVAASFPPMAIANICGLFLSGQIIDRLSARKLFLFQAVPLIAGVAVLATWPAPAALPVALALMGLGGGLSKTTLTAVWAEVFGVAILGTIRSAVAMYMVLISALAPFAFALGLSAGLDVPTILSVFAAAGALALVPAAIAEWRGFV